jgi:hypothetical protein
MEAPLLYSKLLIKSFSESIIHTDNQYFSGLRKVSEQKIYEFPLLPSREPCSANHPLRGGYSDFKLVVQD